MLNLTVSRKWRSLTFEAMQEAVKAKPTLTVRCKRCRAKLATVAPTSVGPLFSSTWTIPALAHSVPGAVVTDPDSGRPVAISEAGDQSITRTTNDAVEDLTVEVFALLQLPSADDDYPDLLVRCASHGDAVLDRLEVIAANRTDRDFPVDVSYPLHEYRLPDPPWPSVHR